MVGEKHILPWEIFMFRAKSCGDGFELKTVYWVAVDAFKNALSDSETKLEASRNINAYSKFFPKKEACFFNGISQIQNIPLVVGLIKRQSLGRVINFY